MCWIGPAQRCLRRAWKAERFSLVHGHDAAPEDQSQGRIWGRLHLHFADLDLVRISPNASSTLAGGELCWAAVPLNPIWLASSGSREQAVGAAVYVQAESASGRSVYVRQRSIVMPGGSRRIAAEVCHVS